jgi:hypothetical protein
MATPQTYRARPDDLPILRKVARASRAQAKLSGFAAHGGDPRPSSRPRRLMTLALGLAFLLGLSSLILDDVAWASSFLLL